MVVIDLPENYVAFVLPDATQAPTNLDQLRQDTLQYVESKLQSQLRSLKTLDLEFVKVEFGSGKPAPRFHLYITCKAQVTLASAAVETAVIFKAYISSFTKAYLDQVVKKWLPNCIEVKARRVGRKSPGGAVTAPRFYLALECKKPQKLDHDELLAQAKSTFSQKLADEMDDFQTLKTLDIVKTQVDGKKPDPSYNLYIEFEAVATFQQNVPEPMDVFRALSSCTIHYAPVQPKRMCLRCVFVDAPNGGSQKEEDEDEKLKQKDDEEDGEPDEGEPEEKGAPPKRNPRKGRLPRIWIR